MNHRRSWRKIGFRSVVIAVLLLIVMTGLIGFYVLPNAVNEVADVLQPAKELVEQQNLNHYLNLSLPATATNFHGVAYSFMQSRIIGLSFQISSGELDRFLQNVGFTSALQIGVNPFHSNSRTLAEDDWWIPETSHSFMGGSFTKSESFYDVLVDGTNAERFVVYMMVEQM